MADGVAAVLAEALALREAGIEVDDDWLRSRSPIHWRTVRKLLDMDLRIRALAPAVTRVARYRLLREIGRGGMGVVWLAEDPSADPPERVAVKLLRAELLGRADATERFLREARVGARVRDPRIVATLDAGIDERDGVRTLYVVTEHVEGQTLRGLVEEMGQVPEDLCRHIATELAGGLAALHRAGVVHRDVKPENVMIDRADRVRLMDLGLAYVDEERGQISTAGGFVGSLAYAAPEQIVARGHGIDGRADLYALGVLLWEIAAGRHPWGDTPNVGMDRRFPSLRRSGAPVSAFYDAVVAKLLAPAPDDRFESADALVEVLRHGTRSRWWRERGPRRAAAGDLRGPEMPWVERETVMQAVERAWDACVDGPGRVVLLTADAGLGKSRVLEEVGERIASDREAAVLRVAFPPGPPYAGTGPVLEAFRELLVGPVGKEVRALHGLGALLGSDSRSRDAATFEVVRTAVVRSARALAARRPVAVLADDLQNADAEGRALVAALADAASDASVLVVAASRPEVDAAWRESMLRLEATTHVQLDPLSDAEVRRLVALRYDSVEIGDELAGEAAPAAGNPLFLREILREMERSGRVERDAEGRWHAERGAGLGVPETIRLLLQARIDGLAREDRELLETAACLGPQFDPGLLAEAAGLSPIATLRATGRIRAAHGLLRSEDDRTAFEPPLAHAVVYEAMDPHARRLLHSRISEAYEARLAAAAGRRTPEELVGTVWHAVRAGAAHAVLAHALDAVRSLVRRYENDRATEIVGACLAVRRGLPPARRTDLLLEAAVLHDRAGRREEEQAVLEEAVRLTGRSGEAAAQARARLRLARCVYDRGAYGEATSVLRTLRRSGARRLTAAERFDLADLLGRCVVRTGAPREGRALFQQALRHAKAAGDAVRESVAEVDLGSLDRRTGRFDAALAHFERAVVTAKRAGDAEAEARAIGNLGSTLESTGQRHRAIRLLRRQVEIARSIGSRPSENVARQALPRALAALGRLADAWREYERAGRYASEIGAADMRAIVDVSWGQVACRLGRLDEARARLDAAIAGARAARHASLEGFSLLRRSQVQAAAGDAAGATADLDAALAALVASGSSRHRSAVLLEQGVAAMERGDAASARERLRAALRDARRNSEGDTESLAAAYLAWLARRTGSEAPPMAPPGAESGTSARLEWNWVAWNATGDRRRLDTAYRLLAQLRRYAPAEDRRTMVERVPLHRAIWEAWHGDGAAKALAD